MIQVSYVSPLRIEDLATRLQGFYNLLQSDLIGRERVLETCFEREDGISGFV